MLSNAECERIYRECNPYYIRSFGEILREANCSSNMVARKFISRIETIFRPKWEQITALRLPQAEHDAMIEEAYGVLANDTLRIIDDIIEQGGGLGNFRLKYDGKVLNTNEEKLFGISRVVSEAKDMVNTKLFNGLPIVVEESMKIALKFRLGIPLTREEQVRMDEMIAAI